MKAFKSFKLIDYLSDGIKKLLGIETETKKNQLNSGSENQGGQPDANIPSGGTLNQEQIARAARAAGFPEDKIATMTAIAMAESSGDSGALNNNANTGDLSYGLWQINMIGDMGPERRKLFGIKSSSSIIIK